MLSSDKIKEYALEAGFSLCGTAAARVLSEHSGRFAAGLEVAGEGRLDYLARRPERRLDPSFVFTGAKTVVSCALAFDGRAARDGVAAFALMDEDYHVKIKRMLRQVLERLQANAGEPGDHVGTLRGKVCCDTAPILEKAWAVEAGLGWQGRNSLLITPEYGSFVMLGEMVLDAVCDTYDEPFRGGGCGSCRACVGACPVGAIGEGTDGTMTVNTARCISARTIEHSRLNPGSDSDSDSPVEPLHGWVWGCDECQRACPQNRGK